MNRVRTLLLALAACTVAGHAAERPAAGVAFERVFPRLSFERPVFLTAAPGNATRLYVVEQAGTIRAFEATVDAAAAAVFLDLREKVSRRGEEEGLLGLAFHPEYARNGLFYVYYSARGTPRQIVAQYRASADRTTADPASERVLLEMPDPWRNHNGGMLAFGPDQMLYIGTGDGGAAGDPKNSGQRLDTLLGKILRVTADGGVPPDNPFVGRAGARGEIWAWGLRNPWRFSFDRATGALWAGDVGQNRWEEIEVIVKGGNYGWRLFEGGEEFDNLKGAKASDFIAPVATYGRDDGCSVTGGYVYRGAAMPALRGQYFYADYCSGKVWALPATGTGKRAGRLVANVHTPSSFGEDAAGELYITSFDGGLYRLTAGP
jgi:glucose/arabinose dehydrogenase